MASCEECNNEINSKAKVCPHCGFEYSSELYRFISGCFWWGSLLLSYLPMILMRILVPEDYIRNYNPILTEAYEVVMYIPVGALGLWMVYAVILSILTVPWDLLYIIVCNILNIERETARYYDYGTWNFIGQFIRRIREDLDWISHQRAWKKASKQINPPLFAQNISALYSNNPNLNFNSTQLYNMTFSTLYWVITKNSLSRRDHFSTEEGNTFELHCWTRIFTLYIARRLPDEIEQHKWYVIPRNIDELIHNLNIPNNHKLWSWKENNKRWIKYLNTEFEEYIKWADEFNTSCDFLQIPFRVYVLFARDTGDLIWLGIKLIKIQN